MRRIVPVALLAFAFTTYVMAAERFYTKFVQSADPAKMTITLKPANKKDTAQVIQVTDETKMGWLYAKDMKATVADFRPGDQVSVKEVDGKVVEINTFRKPGK